MRLMLWTSNAKSMYNPQLVLPRSAQVSAEHARRERLPMSLTTFEATIKNGCVQLPENVSLPENTKVYVLVPRVTSDETARLRSPRLVDSEKAADFRKELITGTSDAGV
jgi:hypothetical protein